MDDFLDDNPLDDTYFERNRDNRVNVTENEIDFSLKDLERNSVSSNSGSSMDGQVILPKASKLGRKLTKAARIPKGIPTL